MHKGHCAEGCAEGLSAKRSLRGGVRRGSECKKVIARRGVRRV